MDEGLDELPLTFCKHRYTNFEGKCLNCGAPVENVIEHTIDDILDEGKK